MTPRALPSALTLVEVLVAIALFAVLATAVAGLWSAALRMSAAAEGSTARVRALEPYTVPAALLTGPPPACGALPPRDTVESAFAPCLELVARCDVDPSLALRCDGAGGLGRIDLRLPPAAAPGTGAGAAPVRLRAWARWRP